jgi:heparanase 1
MGTKVLDPAISPNGELRIYAHCLKDAPGGVAIMVLNIDQKAAHTLQLPLGSMLYVLSAPELLSRTISLNGATLDLTTDGSFPKLTGKSVPSGDLTLASETITFIALPKAKNADCR